MKADATRQQIVDAADQLFYEQGFEATSFAHIASAVGLSRGNFYYHFKTKNEVLEAVIDQRLSRTRAMLETWEEAAEPVERVRSFIRILIVNRAKIMKYGCPVGTLCSELAKLDHPARSDAAKLFTLFRGWLAKQFTLMGLSGEADQLALHALMRSQGIADLATAFRDRNFVEREVAELIAWLDEQQRRATRKAS